MSAVDRRALVLGAVFFLGLAALPLVAEAYLLTVMILVLQYAYVGQAWNLMMGYAGQLSLGHALYFGLGAYAAGVLTVTYGVNPWLGIAAGAVISGMVGAVIAWLGFRFSVRGIYFALLTIAFAEFARILFDHWALVGGSGGFFLPVPAEDNVPILTLRGGPSLYYYIFLILNVLALVGIGYLMRTRIGYYWRAIRDDEDAARALGVRAFRLKTLAVVISAAMTSVAGSIFLFVNGSLFPETTFGIATSIALIVGPVIGGVGTLFGPILGAFVITPLAEIAGDVAERFDVAGLNTLTNGVVILLIVMFMPGGIWPVIARRLGLGSRMDTKGRSLWSRLKAMGTGEARP